MKVLLSAWASEPGKGSESEVGFRTIVAAAGRHQVWVLTNAPYIASVRRALDAMPEGSRVHLHGIEFGARGESFDHLGMIEFQRLYDRWQRDAAHRAIELDREVDFDVVHHVTLSSYWTRAGVAEVPKPLVWGPVGGGVHAPLPLVRDLGPRGVVEDMARALVRPVLARLPAVRLAPRNAAVTLFQNEATSRKVRFGGRGRVLSNALAVDLNGIKPPASRRGSDLVVVGRLLPWKGAVLALRMMRHVRHPGARLHMCGDGPELDRLRELTRKWGLSERVHFPGWMPRDELLSSLATAGALVHPSLHEEGGMCVAEALALGTPVVCLDHGGPAETLRLWPRSPAARITPERPESTARAMARAADHFLGSPPPVPTAPVPPTVSFASELLAEYEFAAARHVTA